MSVKGLAHAAIQAEDYEGTLDFYIRVLGFTVGHSWSLPAFKIKTASMLVSPDGRTCIEVFDRGAEVPAEGDKAPSREEVKHGALLHLAFYVDHVDEMVDKALAHGARIYVEPGNLELGEPALRIRNAVLHSPNGEIIELIEEVDFNVGTP